VEANPDQLCEVEGVGRNTAAYLNCMGLLVTRVTQQEMPAAINSLDDFIKFLTDRYHTLKTEVLELFAIDPQDNIIAHKRYEGDYDHVDLSQDELGEFLSQSHPDALLMAHNHVGSRCAPSERDDKFTVHANMVCTIHNVKLFDHLIIGCDGAYSYYALGRLQEMKSTFDLNKMIAEQIQKDRERPHRW
jgi:DNA repair protein RadC